MTLYSSRNITSDDYQICIVYFIVSDDDLSSHDSDEASHDLSLSSDES